LSFHFKFKYKGKVDKLKKLAVLLLVILVLLIIIFDVGNFATHNNGAGDIWWTEIDGLFEIEHNQN